MSSTLPNTSSDPGSNTMWPPGTIRLADVTASEEETVILQPRPSDDPNDPLNWAPWRKYLNMGLACFYVAMAAEFINANTPTWDPMETQLGFTDEILNDSYAAGCAALAVGSLILIPFALKYGRRPLYLFSTVVQFAVSIWSAKMQTVGDLMGINVIQCFFGSLAEVIVQMTIADLFFVHQRGRMNALYVWTWLLSSYLGILIAGFVASGPGWRWIWWLNAIIFGLAIFVVGFGYEETKYCPPASLITANTQFDLSIQDRPMVSNIQDENTKKDSSNDIEDKSRTEAKQIYADQTATDQASIKAGDGTTSHSTTFVGINPNIPMKGYWQRLTLLTTTSSSSGVANDSFFRHMYQPLIILVTIPAVTWTALVYGILVALGDVMSTTMSAYLPEPPYNFSTYEVGLMSLPRVIGVTIGALIVGPFSDWWILFLSRRRNGIFEPEMRLWCMIPFLPFVVAGALLFAIGLNDHRPWPVIAVGLMLYNIGVTPINTLTITYLTDSYKDVSSRQNFLGDLKLTPKVDHWRCTGGRYTHT
jgi:MFS family permease